MTTGSSLLRDTLVSLTLLAAAAAAARAQPSTDEQTAATVEAAPAPGYESGRADSDPGDSTLRIAARGALYLPKLAVTAVFAPIEGSAWMFERYQLADRATRLFFNDAGTVGLFPTFALESGFGINVGARFVSRDTFGLREHFDLRASTGGRFHQKAATSFRTGDRLGKHTSLELGAEYEQRAKDSFYGIGNADESAVEMPIDPISDDIASRGRYRHRVARVTAALDRHLVDRLHLRAAGQVADHRLGTSETGRAIEDVFAMEGLVGFDGVRNAYGEVELRFDSRRRASMWDPAPVPAAGWLVAGFAGRTTALDSGADFWRYGVDLQKFISLGIGPRVLSFRARGEAVTGETTDVPFIELPRIGGGTTLRGYAVDRFRDRVAVTGSVQYQWDLAQFLSASLFVDGGKVASSLGSLDGHEVRVGYGVALDAYTTRSYVARATLASSRDGGVFFNVALDPVFELAGRTERR